MYSSASLLNSKSGGSPTPTLHYKMDSVENNVLVEEISGVNGTTIGNPYSNGREVILNGGTQYVTIPSNDHTDIGTSDFSINIAFTSNTNGGYLYSNVNGGGYGINIDVNTSSKRIRINTYTVANGLVFSFLSSSFYNTGIKTMLTFTRKNNAGSDTYEVFINGVSQLSQTKGFNADFSDAVGFTKTFGRQANISGGYLDGALHDIKYDQTALTQTEIDALYTEFQQDPVAPSPTLIYPFDSVTGDILEETVNSLDGSLIGSPTLSGGGILFDGSTQYATIADSSLLSYCDAVGNDLPFTKKIIFELSSTGVVQYISSKIGVGYEWSIYIDSSNKINVRLYTSSSVYVGVVSANAITSGTKYTLHITNSSSKSYTGLGVYLQGYAVSVLSSNSGTYTGMSNTTAPTTLCKSGAAASGYMSGIRYGDEEIKGYEMTPAQVLSDYQNS